MIDKNKTAKQNKGVTRRQFLKGAGAVTAATALASVTPRVAFGAPALLRQQKRVVEMWMWETPEQWLKVEADGGLNEKFPDVEFKWTSLPFNDLHQKAIASLVAGIPEGLPSIFRTYNTFYRPLVNTQSVLEVTEQVTPYEADVFPPVWLEGQLDGKHYHVPDDTIVYLHGYRTDIFEAAGLSIDPAEVRQLLATYDDLIKVGQTIKDKTGASIIELLPDGAYFQRLAGQNTTGLFDSEGNVIFDSEVHLAAAETVKRLWDSGLTLEVSGPQYWQAMKDNMLATTLYPNYLDFVIQDNAPETAGKWRVTGMPALNADSKRTIVWPGLGLVIPAILPEDQQQLALEIALYMKLTEKATVAHMKTFPGAFVSYVPGLEAMREEPSPVLNDQFTFQVFLDAFAEEQPLPRLVTSAFDNDASTAVNDAMFRILKENAPIQETLVAAADSVRQLQDSQGMK
jgi:ABC-type glycerol-3-phosphate transport system substrate-binding protein